jgi:hypothetical protein
LETRGSFAERLSSSARGEWLWEMPKPKEVHWQEGLTSVQPSLKAARSSTVAEFGRPFQHDLFFFKIAYNLNLPP